MQYEVSATHHTFDHGTPSVLTIESGDVVLFECPTVLDWGPEATLADMMGRDRSKAHALAGPVEICGAEPGDALLVEIIDIQLAKDYGTIFFLPGYGLLPDDFAEPYMKVIPYVDGRAVLKPGVSVPTEPFLGIMGNAPAEAGTHSTIPPRAVGGNIDIRHLRPGSSLTLPVAVKGALFSCGDGHAVQGDGEVCVTAVETAVRATLRFRLLKKAAPSSPQAFIKGPIERQYSQAGYLVTTGLGEDLYACSQTAIRNMIDLLERDYNFTREEAYCLCSMAADLKISEIVNRPNFIVSAFLPLGVFEKIIQH